MMRFVKDSAQYLGFALLTYCVMSYQEIGDRAERLFFPILKESSVYGMERGEEYACAIWKFKRTRQVEFDNLDSRVVLDNGDVIDVPALNWSNGPSAMRYFQRSKTPPPSPNFHYRVVCFDLERAQIHNEAFTAFLRIDYYTGHRLWRVSYNIPAVYFPARDKNANN